MATINSWKDIRWVPIEEKVFRLQLRIYKAAANGELEKMYKLQKLLISSKSARYLSVRKVTQQNSGKVDNIRIKTSSDKFALAEQLTLDGKSSDIKRTYINSPDGKQRPLGIPTIKDRSKQMLAYLALCPQWEASFEAASYGFRPSRSVQDAMDGIARKPKWVLDADISKCFDQINHQYLLEKCNTFPKMQKQIRAWLKAGILDGDDYAFLEMGGIISPLLDNIALHDIRQEINTYINSLGGHRPNNKQAFPYVRYADDFVFMHPDKKVIDVVQKFLESIRLEFQPDKTRLIHTLNSDDGFPFLDFDIVQKEKRLRQVKRHRIKLKDVIQRYRGISQERLIQKLNPIIRGWALSKRTQLSSKTCQAMDQYVYLHLWKWARKRHPKMSRYKLKEKYWHQVGSRNWVFGMKYDDTVLLQLQMHSKITIKRFAKVKGTASPFDSNRIYWAKRSGKSPLIPDIKAKLRTEPNSRFGIYKKAFLPDDIIECGHIVPKALGERISETM